MVKDAEWLGFENRFELCSRGAAKIGAADFPLFSNAIFMCADLENGMLKWKCFDMPVSLKKHADLARQMTALGIHERDIEEHFVRSSGRGGQNVNKVSTCVVLKHLPTGIEVKCQKERSQAINRFLARRILMEKIERILLGKKSEAEKKEWKIRKQKRRRSRRAKEKMLKDKSHQSEKKELRRKIEFNNN